MKVERGGSRGRLSAFLHKATGWEPKKAPGVSKRERCVRRLARAIRRANRAGADTRPRPHAKRAQNRDTPVPPFAWKEAPMTATDPAPPWPHSPAETAPHDGT